MQRVKDILNKKLEEKKPRYVKHEFQDYGYRLAQQLNDLKRKSLYIRLAKKEKRELLEEARIFALDYPKPRSRAKIFMWKLEELKKQA